MSRRDLHRASLNPALASTVVSHGISKCTMAPFTLISTLPPFISPDEHKNIVASTPASFSDIPPVLRHREENVSVTVEPPVDGFTAEDCALGTLYVIER